MSAFDLILDQIAGLRARMDRERTTLRLGTVQSSGTVLLTDGAEVTPAARLTDTTTGDIVLVGQHNRRTYVLGNATGRYDLVRIFTTQADAQEWEALGGGRVGLYLQAAPWKPLTDASLWAMWDVQLLGLADGAAVSTLPDASGNLRPMAPIDAARTLTYDVDGLGGTPGLAQGSTAAALQTAYFTPVIPAGQAVTMVCNAKVTNTNSGTAFGGVVGSDGAGYIGYHNLAAVRKLSGSNWVALRGNQTLTKSPAGADSDPHTFVTVFDGANSRFYIDGTLVASGATQATTIGGFSLAGLRNMDTPDPVSATSVVASGSVIGDAAVFTSAFSAAKVAEATEWFMARRGVTA